MPRHPHGWAAVLVAITSGVVVSACGGAGATAAAPPPPSYRVTVVRAAFPRMQRLAQRTRLVISVRNTGSRTIPNIAVTITNPRWGTAARAFSTVIAPQPGLASRSRPVWIVDRPPGACRLACGSGGPGGAQTAYANTWALGALPPRRTARFVWNLTAVAAGRYLVRYQLAAALQPAARAIRADGLPAGGVFAVTISGSPRIPYVQDNGQVVYSP